MAYNELTFIRDYSRTVESIEGWFQFDAALLFWAYNQLIAADGITGHVLEIGVHHGRSAIATASLRGEGKLFHAVDLFDELQCHNKSRSGQGNRDAFLKNMQAFHDRADLRLHPCLSTDIRPQDLGSGFSFCHVDGGHSAKETYHDLKLAHGILVPGGLLALDDYFHAAFPGVSEGAVRFMLEQPKALIPLAIGFNKVLFQKALPLSDINLKFSTTFNRVPKRTVELWEEPAFLFEQSLNVLFDLERSTPRRLQSQSGLGRALIEPQCRQLTARCSEQVVLPVRIVNQGVLPFQAGQHPFGISYHLMSNDGTMLRFDNDRNLFAKPLHPNEERICDIVITAPKHRGFYKLEVDIVWEGVMWLKDDGNRAGVIDLTVV